MRLRAGAARWSARRSGDYERSTRNLLDRLGLELPAGRRIEPRMKRQSDGINDDWTRRYSEIRLATQFDVEPAALEAAPAG